MSRMIIDNRNIGKYIKSELIRWYSVRYIDTSVDITLIVIKLEWFLKKITEKSYKFIVSGNAWSNVNVNYGENDKFIADIEFNITFNDNKYSYPF